MDAFASLKSDHKKVSRLFEKLTPTKERAAKTRSELLAQLNQELSIHTHIEEEILYPAVKKCKELSALGFESVEEHKIIKLLLRELSSYPPDSREWTAKLAVLKECLEHHVREEEQELFPRAAKLLSGEELEDLALLLEEEKIRSTADPFRIVHSM